MGELEPVEAVSYWVPMDMRLYELRIESSRWVRTHKSVDTCLTQLTIVVRGRSHRAGLGGENQIP